MAILWALPYPKLRPVQKRSTTADWYRSPDLSKPLGLLSMTNILAAPALCRSANKGAIADIGVLYKTIDTPKLSGGLAPMTELPN